MKQTGIHGTVKRLLAAMTVLALCLTAYACSGDAENDTAVTTDAGVSESETTETTAADPRASASDRLPQRDYGGAAFSFLVYSDAISPMTLVDSETMTGDVVNDAVYDRNTKIEERFGVELFFEAVKPGNYLAEAAQRVILAGDTGYDVYLAHYSQGPTTLLSAGLLYNWRDVPYLQLDEPWWNRSLVSELEINGYLPFLVGDLSLASYCFTFAMIFNKGMIAAYNLDSPYETVHSGLWTLDRFSEYIAAVTGDVNGDGQFDINDRYGYAVDNSVHYQIYPMACGIEYVKKNADGYPEINGKTERFATLIEKLNAIYWQGNNTFTFPYDTLCPIPWDEDRVLLLTLWLRDIEEYRNADSDFGFLPFPKYDETQAEYYTCANARCCLFLAPVNTADPERTGIIMEALTVESYKSVIPAYYDVALYTKYVRDEESAAMLDIIFAGRRYDFGFVFTTAVTGNTTRELVGKKSTDYSSYYDKNYEASKAVYDKLYEAYLSYGSK